MKFLSLVFWSVSAVLLAGCDGNKPPLVIGEPIPGFQLEKLEGGHASFPGDYKGRVIALRFWADWCPFCESEMIALEPVYQRHRARGLEILAVNVRQDRETTQNFIDKLDISYGTLLDIEGEVARSYGVTGLPTTYFIDAGGILRRRILGESTPEVFDQVVRELLP